MSRPAKLHDSTAPLDLIVANLIEGPDTDELVASNPALARGVEEKVGLTARRSFREGDGASRRVLHRALRRLYGLDTGPSAARPAPNRNSRFLVSLRDRMEKAWEVFEYSRLALRREHVPATAESFASFFREYCSSHPAASHRLFDYLKLEATRDDIIRFFIHDCAFDPGFYKLAAPSIAGPVRAPRAEPRDRRDETGRVEENIYHTLLRRVSEYGNCEPFPDSFIDGLGWQELAGHNLFLYFGLRRINHFRSVGGMTVAKFREPALYAKLLAGCERVGLVDGRAPACYMKRIAAQAGRREDWLADVMLPQLRADMGAAYEMLVGAGMCLNIRLDYYEYLCSEVVPGSRV